LGVMSGGRDNSGTVDKVDTPRQRNVLPNLEFRFISWSEKVLRIADLRFARHGCDPADLATFDRVDDATLPYIWVTDEPNRDLFLIRV
jgi:hypothetical protein